MSETIGYCAVCDDIVSRDSPYEWVHNDENPDECLLCEECCSTYSDNELKEMGIEVEA